MIDTAFLHELNRFNLILRKRVTSKYSGERKSLTAGRGMMLKDHRIYVPGDDFRAIDWKIYARTDDLYIKTYEEDKSLVVHTVVDASKSMDYGKPRKFDFASMLAVGFAYLAMKENEKFRFSTFAEELTIFQPKKDMGHLAGMIIHLNKIKLEGKSQFFKPMQKYKKTIGSRSMVVLLSDFLFDIDEIREGLYQFKHQDVKVVQVLDKSELDMNLEGDYRLRDSETRDEIRTEITTRMREEYKQRMREHAAAVKNVVEEIGGTYVLGSTEKSVFDIFYEALA